MVGYTRQSVGLLRCRSYDREALSEKVDTLLKGLAFSVPKGSKVLLKPNLVTGRGSVGLACTNPAFVASVAQWFIEHGVTVAVGDSPAFGSAKQVMRAAGITEALRGMPVTLLDFKKKHPVKLACGLSITLAAEVLEFDQLINLPKLKAHSQMLVSLAVKNLFGVVLGCRKAIAHMRYGERDNLFAQLLVDLIAEVPSGVSIIDGITGMHRDGPVAGKAFETEVVGASRDPVALDSAIMQLINVNPRLSPLWQECERRQMAAINGAFLDYPLQSPDDLAVSGFVLPSELAPIRFQLSRFLKNSVVKILKKQ